MMKMNDLLMKEGEVRVTQGIMVTPQYGIFKPQSAGSFEEQWNECLNDFQLFLDSNSDRKAFIVRVFVGASTADEYFGQAEIIEKSLSASGIPFSVLAESPEKPSLVLIEAGFITTSEVSVEYGVAATVRYSRITASGYSEYWFAGVDGGNTEHSLSEKSHSAFARLLEAFLQLGIDFNQVFRQWNYVEQIFSIQQIDSCRRQNYQLFNEARAEYYSKYRTVPGFPAATGIGTAFNGVTIECMAVVCDEETVSVAIANPQQLNSYKYGQEVLKGEPQKNSSQNQPPQFERARLMTNGSSSRLFVSGTASIIGQETIGLDDVEKQTRVTIENIAVLVSESNLRAHYPGLRNVPDKYAYVRVYVKNQEDIPLVKAICLDHFGNVPTTFVQADICRENLLVEIEAEMVN